MKKCLLLPCILIFTSHFAKAQLGITVASTVNHAPDWQVAVENFVAYRRTGFLKYGTAATADFTFPLKNEALRLQPALHFTRATWWFYPHYFEVYSIGIQCNMNFALLPATNAAGKPSLFRPFLQLSPGFDLTGQRYDAPAGDGVPFQGEYTHHGGSSLAFNAGANLLLEFRLTELLTVSPIAGIRFYPGLEWENFTQAVSEGAMARVFDRTHWRQYLFGLRMGWDFKKGDR